MIGEDSPSGGPGTATHETPLERLANVVTHAAGAGLGIAALVLLIVAAAWTQSAWAVVSVIVYGLTLIFMFASSALYHGVSHHRWREALEACDHIAIFLLIAGTYTPITLIALDGWEGWLLLGLVWALAIGGIVTRLIWLRYLHWSFIVVYLAMGWIGFLFADRIASTLGDRGVNLILIGGLFYTVGLIFYAWRKLPFNHMAWHLFVMAGGVFHFFAIFYYVVPRAA